MNLANRPGPKGGIPGSAAGNLRAPVTAFIAEMSDGLPAAELRLQAPPPLLLREQLQAIPLLRALIELEPAYSKSE